MCHCAAFGCIDLNSFNWQIGELALSNRWAEDWCGRLALFLHLGSRLFGVGMGVCTRIPSRFRSRWKHQVAGTTSSCTRIATKRIYSKWESKDRLLFSAFSLTALFSVPDTWPPAPSSSFTPSSAHTLAAAPALQAAQGPINQAFSWGSTKSMCLLLSQQCAIECDPQFAQHCPPQAQHHISQSWGRRQRGPDGCLDQCRRVHQREVRSPFGACTFSCYHLSLFKVIIWKDVAASHAYCSAQLRLYPQIISGWFVASQVVCCTHWRWVARSKHLLCDAASGQHRVLMPRQIIMNLQVKLSSGYTAAGQLCQPAQTQHMGVQGLRSLGQSRTTSSAFRILTYIMVADLEEQCTPALYI